jgi:hypothetical protein
VEAISIIVAGMINQKHQRIWAARVVLCLALVGLARGLEPSGTAGLLRVEVRFTNSMRYFSS